jgi:hypothetical protein
VKKLLVVLMIAFVGAGIAFGASTVFFSSSSDRSANDVEPQGLVEDIATAAPDETDEPSPSPKDEDEGSPSVGSGGTGSAAAASTADEPQRAGNTGTIVSQKNGLVLEDEGNTDFSEECRDEDSEDLRDQCEDELEAEADEEEEEAEQEAKEDEDKADERADDDKNND